MSIFDEIYEKPQDIEGLARYDKNTHRWVLDISAMKPMFLTARSDEQLRRKAESYSRHIYSWLYKDVVTTQNRSFVEWLISCTKEGREAMLTALQEQAEADAESDINSLSLASPVDLSNGNVFDGEALRSGSIAVYAKDALDDASVLIGGTRIYFNKRFDYGIRFGQSDYERYDY